MAYDPEKDRRIYVHPEVEGDRNSQILIGVYVYNGGPAKVRVNRAKTMSDGEVKVGKLGGMSEQEAKNIGLALVEIAENPNAWIG